MLLRTQKKKIREKNCISTFEITSLNFAQCQKQINSKSNAMEEKTTDFIKEFPKNKIKVISKIEKIAKKSIIYNRR